MEEQNDQMLVWQCLQGDTAAFAILVGRYKKPVFNVALRMTGSYETAEDISQSVFVKMYEKLDTVDYKRNVFNWVYTMAVNESINLLKRSNRHRPLDAAAGYQAPEGKLENGLQISETSEQVKTALMTLNTDYRTAIVLKYFAGFSYEEMSGALGIPVKTVKSRLFSARQLLKDQLIAQGMIENERGEVP